jgi:hypothetical protein
MIWYYCWIKKKCIKLVVKSLFYTMMHGRKSIKLRYTTVGYKTDTNGSETFLCPKQCSFLNYSLQQSFFGGQPIHIWLLLVKFETIYLPPPSTVLLEKLTVAQLDTKFPEYYAPRWLITAFPTLSQTNRVLALPNDLLKIYFNIILPFTSRSSK